jgi:hypothetical protein
MPKQRLILFFISSILICLNLKSQKRNNLIFETSAFVLNPIKEEIHFVHEKEFADDYAYNIKMAPKISYGFKGAIGFQLCLGKGEEIKFHVPILLSYKFITMIDKQIGEYYGGYANEYFYGNRYSNVFINIFSLSSGLNTSFVNSFTNNEWNIDLNFSNNLNTITVRDLKEKPINCYTCQSKEENYNFIEYFLLKYL